jgi:DNA polymerase elongation subunit (family B)
MTEKIPLQELAVSNTLRKAFNKYRSIFPHVAAAIQLASRGKIVKEGEDVSFIYRDVEHHNPLYRVTPLELADANVNFDRKKYREMLLGAAETVLSTFSIPREAYNTPNRPKFWLRELREEIRDERRLEVDKEVLDSAT